MKRITSLLFLFFLLFASPLSAQTTHTNASNDRLNTIGLTVYGLAPVVVYERIIPFGERFGLIGAVGGYYYDQLGFTLGATAYFGAERHRGEAGAAYLDDKLTIAYAAYRYTDRSGLFAKGGLGYTFFGNEGAESGVVPILALGYAF